MTYLVLACKPGRVLRSTCSSVQAALMASCVYRRAGWAVTVLGEVGAE